MKRRIIIIHAVFLCIGLAGVLLLTPEHVLATIGGTADSIESDRRALLAESQSSPTFTGSGYAVHELRSDANTVREYVSPSGIVFAVAWEGRTHPDLSQLLGSYAGEYKAARQAQPLTGNRAYGTIKTDNIVVETWGHMRNLHGRAYVPALMPGGDINEIQ